MVLAENAVTSGATLSALWRHALEEKASAPHCGKPFGSLRLGKQRNA
jgi:hypothetical protein